MRVRWRRLGGGGSRWCPADHEHVAPASVRNRGAAGLAGAPAGAKHGGVPAAQLAGKCEVYAGVVQGDPAAGVTHICVEARPKGTARGEELLSGEAAALTVEASEADASSELVLSLTTLDAASFGECAKLSYQVWVAHTADDGGASNFFTWCGISRGGAMLHEVSAADLGAAAGRRTLRVPHASVQRRISGTMLGVTHRVTVVALVQPTCTPAAGVATSEAPRAPPSVRADNVDADTGALRRRRRHHPRRLDLAFSGRVRLRVSPPPHPHGAATAARSQGRRREAGPRWSRRLLGLYLHEHNGVTRCLRGARRAAAAEPGESRGSDAARGRRHRRIQRRHHAACRWGRAVVEAVPRRRRSARVAAATPSTVPASSERAARGGARAALPRRHRWSWSALHSATARLWKEPRR